MMQDAFWDAVRAEQKNVNVHFEVLIKAAECLQN